MFQSKSKQQPKSKSINNQQNPFSQINPNDFIPKRFGLHFQRPTIIMEYLVPSSGKLYHHKMRLEQKLKDNMPVNEILSHLRARHQDYLIDVSDNQLTKLINSLKNKLSKTNQIQTKAPLKTQNQNQYSSKQPPETKQQQQQQQQQPQQQQSSKLGKLEPLGLNKGLSYNENKKKSNIFEEDVDDLLNDLGFPEDKPKKINYEKNSFNANRNPTNNNFGFNSLNKKEDNKDYNNFDLNKLTTEELQKEKEKMDEKFLVNQKKPGDKGFVYDIQEDFEPYEDNEWDMDEDEEDIV